MNLFKSTLIISALTLVSRIAGLIREVLFAAYFGASSQTDAFFVAFRIPNLLRRLFAEGALSQAFIPVLSEVKAKNGTSACQKLGFKVAILLFFTLIFITFLGIVFASYIVFTLSDGFNGDTETFELSITLTKIMFPYILFISLTALAAGILNTFLRYNLPAFTPVLLNISFIISIIFVAPVLEQPIYSLAYAVIIGGVAQLSTMIVGLSKIGFFSNALQIIKKNDTPLFFDENIKKVFRIFFPATFAVSIAQISLIINTNIASRLETGSVSWLSYADRLMEFPTALLGVALGTVLLPKLAEAWTNENKTQVSALIDWGLKLAVLISLPTCIVFFNMSEALAAVVFHYGVFSDNDLAKSAVAIRGYSIGIVGLIAIKIIAPGFYARQDIKTPVLIGIATLCMTQFLNLFLVPAYQHAGLAYAISIAACFNAFVLLIVLIRKKIYTPDRTWILFLARVLISCSVVYIFSDLSNLFFDWKNLKESPLTKIVNFLLILLAIIFLYVSVCKLTGINFKHFIKKV